LLVEQEGAQLWRTRELWLGSEAAHAEFEWLDACAQFVLRTEALSQSGGLLPDVQRMAWGINPALWAPVRGRSVSLRRLGLRDASDVHAMLQEPGFVHLYSRGLPTALPAVEAWLKAAQTPRWPVRRIEFVVVCNSTQQVMGLASLAELSVDDRRAELLVGIRPTAQRKALGSAGIEATSLLLHFAFERIGLNKLMSYVYEDNPHALKNTLHLGFVREGTLSNHVWDKALNRFVSIHVQALLRDGYECSDLLQKLRVRYLKDV
jgi:RimJ/RimL family protein N-acetyltransferase